MKPVHMGLSDPTYARENIDSNSIWKFAFEMSELDNDNAPIRWGQYIPPARMILDKYELKEK